MRIGELVQLKLSDIDLLTTPTSIRLRAKITKTRKSRETFISSEATKALKDYLSVTFDWKENNNSNFNDVILFGRGTLGGYKKKSIIEAPEHLTASESLMRQLRLHLAKNSDLDKNNIDGSKIIHFMHFVISLEQL